MSTPINTALLSFGMSGKVFHAPFIHAHPGFRLLGAWERSTQHIQTLYPGVQSYTSFESLLADPELELVIVNTPTYTHYEYCKAALLAGKHVVVEKAFTTTAAEAAELNELADAHGKCLSVFQNRRWDSDFSTVKKVKADGLLGDIVEAEFRFERYKPAIGPRLHKENPAPGAGLLNDLGPHLIDQALHLFGKPGAVYADIRITRPGSLVDDWFDIVLQYTDCRVRLKSGYFCREPLPAYVLQGTLGTFMKSRSDLQEALLTAGEIPTAETWAQEPDTEQGLLHTEQDGKAIKTRIATQPGNYYWYYDAVCNAIRSGLSVPVSAAEGLQVMQVIEAARKSSELKALVQF